MKTSSIEILEKSELPTEQAHAILKVLEQEMASSQDNLATKADMAALRADMAQLRLETKAEVNAMGSKLAWMVLTCFVTQLGVMVAGMALLYAHSGK